MAALKSIVFIGIVAVLSFVLLIGQVNAGGDKLLGSKGTGTNNMYMYGAPAEAAPYTR